EGYAGGGRAGLVGGEGQGGESRRQRRRQPARRGLSHSLSFRLASSHKASISGRLDSAGVLPRARRPSSTARKRRRNFRFAAFSALSGSAPSLRAGFTPTNRGSPISSSTAAGPASPRTAAFPPEPP